MKFLKAFFQPTPYHHELILYLSQVPFKRTQNENIRVVVKLVKIEEKLRKSIERCLRLSLVITYQFAHHSSSAKKVGC